jgi:hypothetical protein
MGACCLSRAKSTDTVTAQVLVDSKFAGLVAGASRAGRVVYRSDCVSLAARCASIERLVASSRVTWDLALTTNHSNLAPMLAPRVNLQGFAWIGFSGIRVRRDGCESYRTVGYAVTRAYACMPLFTRKPM